MPGVSVCFPAYNEESSVESVLIEAHELLSASGLDYEILVCDDGSTDETGSIINNVAARLPLIRALHNPGNQGIRATFERLYRESVKDFVFLNSTDQQWQTSVLFDLLRLTPEFDIVIATRNDKHYGLVRRIVSGVFNLVPRILFGVNTYDAGAVKLVRREIIERFALVSRSPFSEAERLIRAAHEGYRIASYPVNVSERRTGRARGVSVPALTQAFTDVVRVWWLLRIKKEDQSYHRSGSTGSLPREPNLSASFAQDIQSRPQMESSSNAAGSAQTRESQSKASLATGAE